MKVKKSRSHWAASLLIQVAGTLLREDMPELLTPERGSALFNDAMQCIGEWALAEIICADSTTFCQ